MKNSSEVIDWFNKLENKNSLHFLNFDVVSFYPSISQKLFDETLSWAKQFHNFSEEDLSILRNSRKSFSFLNQQPWVKKHNNNNFDVTMGAYDGAEVAELCGLYVLHKLESVIDQHHLGLYRDDGLAVVRGSGPEIERLRKKYSKFSKQ